jgi:two-component system, chemotaxis family, chemotaxis protein CheY
MKTPQDTSKGGVLIVDDNPEHLKTTSVLLQTQGWSVVAAQNGREALDRLKTGHNISLILLDLWMPSMNGWEFLHRQKDDPEIAGIPVVVLSAIPAASVHGAKTVLKKPVDARALIAIVEHYSKSITAAVAPQS